MYVPINKNPDNIFKPSYLFVALFISCIVGLIAGISGIEPLTDYLRHIREYDYRPLGGYAYMFPDSLWSDLHGYNPYYLFDTLVGLLSSLIGLHNSTSVVEAISFTLYSYAVYHNSKKEDGDCRYAIVVTGATVVFVWAMCFRAVQLRPAMFVSLIFYFLLPTNNFKAGFIGSMLSAGLHWLYFMFTIPLAVGQWLSGSKRSAHGLLIGTLVSFAGSYFVSGGSSLLALKKVFGVISTTPLLIAPEMKSPISLLLVPETSVIILAFLFSLYKKRKKDVYLTTLVVCIPLFIQERFAHDLCIPLMLFYIINVWRDELFKASQRVTLKVAIIGAVLAILMCSLSFVEQMGIKSRQVKWVRHLNLPIGTRIFSSSISTYPLIYDNVNPIQVYPPIESTFAHDKDTESVLEKIMITKTISNEACAYFIRNKIEYVLSYASTSAGCLTEVNVDRTKNPELKIYGVISPPLI